MDGVSGLSGVYDWQKTNYSSYSDQLANAGFDADTMDLDSFEEESDIGYNFYQRMFSSAPKAIDPIDFTGMS
jgi:hypothetical protein